MARKINFHDKSMIVTLDKTGIDILSLIGDGVASTIIPMLADMNPPIGSVKINVPKKAIKPPIMVPSKLFCLLNGTVRVPNLLPKIDAQPSPRVRTDMATYFAGLGNTTSVRTIPVANSKGDVAKLHSSSPNMALVVIEEKKGKYLPFNLAYSESI